MSLIKYLSCESLKLPIYYQLSTQSPSSAAIYCSSNFYYNTLLFTPHNKNPSQIHTHSVYAHAKTIIYFISHIRNKTFICMYSPTCRQCGA